MKPPLLPTASGRPRAAAPGPATQPDRSNVVIVADTDPAVRALMARTLREDGYAPYVTDSGERVIEHLIALRTHERPLPRLLIAGASLRGLSGVELARGLQTGDWGIPVILVPRRAADRAGVRRDRHLGPTVILESPFSWDAFRTAVMNAQTVHDSRRRLSGEHLAERHRLDAEGDAGHA